MTAEMLEAIALPFAHQDLRVRAEKPSSSTAHEDAPHGATQFRVVGEQVANAEWKRDHPLANRNVGQDLVDHVRGGVGHAPRATRGAEAAAFAGKGDQLVTPAARAEDARKTEGEQSALQIAVGFALDKARQAAANAWLSGTRDDHKNRLLHTKDADAPGKKKKGK